MAGSIKWFVYTTDGGNDYAIRLDESNTEAVNGSTQDYVDGLALVDALPRNIKARYVEYSNPTRTRVIKCVCLTPTIFGAIAANVPSVPTIPDPIDDGNLGLLAVVGERRRLPVPYDTGLTDGDAT